MTREDVFAEIIRELDEAWEQSKTLLKSRLDRQRDVELGVSRSTHEKMRREFINKLQKEEQAARADAEERKRSSKKRGSGGIFSWLSPGGSNKKARGGDDESNQDDDDDDEDEEEES